MSKTDKDRPMHVWLSLECGPFSRMQNVNQRNDKQKEELSQKRANCIRQYVGGLLIYTYCVQEGIPVTWEWSETCDAWRLPMVQKVFQRYPPLFSVVKGFRVDLRNPKSRAYLGKGWKLATTHELLAKRMHLTCVCQEKHVLCQGSLTRMSAYYTETFAKRVCKAILDGLDFQDLTRVRGSPAHTLWSHKYTQEQFLITFSTQSHPRTQKTGVTRAHRPVPRVACTRRRRESQWGGGGGWGGG